MSQANEVPPLGVDSWNDPKPSSAVSQIDELLMEHASLLNELSSEIIRTRKRFEFVLLPEPLKGESAGGPGLPVPDRSALGYAIKGQSELVRSMLADLRSINERSTV